MSSRQPLAQNRYSLAVHPMHLKNMFRQIQPDCCNLAHGWLPVAGDSTPSILALRCREGAIHPIIRQRRCASEHPFGTIKRMTAGGRFLTRAFKKVSGEAALSVLPYNLIRAINLAGAKNLRARARLSQAKEAPVPWSL